MTRAAQVLARTEARQTAFLQAFAELGTITGACRTSGVGRRSVYDWLADDERFAREFDAARETAADVLEAECRRRGLEGVEEPVYYQGQVVGTVRRYSDACLLALLKAYRPDRFTGRGGHAAPVDRVAVVRVSYDHNMKPDKLE